MKAKLNQKAFQPIEVTITLETFAELKTLLALTELGTEERRDALKNNNPYALTDKESEAAELQELFDVLDEIYEEVKL